MNRFVENNCRLCREVFCCVSCRLDHERHVHRVNPECEICVYGRVALRDFPRALLEHIEAHHWPLHCLKCGRCFEAAGDLIKHVKCTAGVTLGGGGFSKRAPGAVELKYDSPPLSDFHRNLPNPSMAATSTPTLRVVTETKVTPVGIAEKEQHEAGSPQNVMSNEQTSKRRVTFCETPILEYSGRKQLSAAHRSESIAEEDVCSKLKEGSTGKPLELSVSPLIKINGIKPDSPDTETQSHKSIIAGSNQYFLGTQNNNEAVTSTPRLDKLDNKPREPEDAEIPLTANKTENEPKLYHMNPSDMIPKVSNADNNDQGEIKNEICLESYQTPVAPANMRCKQVFVTKGQFTDETTGTFYTPNNNPEQISTSNTLNLSKEVLENDENLHNEVIEKKYKKLNNDTENCNKTKVEIEETLWMSAVNNFEYSQDENKLVKKNICLDKDIAQSEILSVCVKKIVQVPQNAVGISTESHEESPSNLTSSLWNSVTQAINSVVNGLSFNKSGIIAEAMSSSSKRSWIDDDVEDYGPELKRMKIADIKCRRTIRPICPLSHPVFKVMIDKATQTD